MNLRKKELNDSDPRNVAGAEPLDQLRSSNFPLRRPQPAPMSASVSISTLKDDAYAFIFDQRGLMQALALGNQDFQNQALRQ
jgi:hypothetical protein